MRITIATGPMLPVPALRGGAIPRMWQGLGEAFAAQGHDVCVFARAFAGQPGEERIAGVRYRRWGGFDQGSSVYADLARDFAYALRAAHRLPPADILVTNDFWLPVFAGARQRTSGRVVVNANRFPKGQYFLYGRVARIAAASSAVRDAIVAQAPGLDSRIRIFPNPLDTEVMRPGDPPRAGEPRTLLYVGRLHPEKGVHVLAAAFAAVASRHPGWRLRVVGPWRAAEGGGGDAYLAQLRGALEGLPAEIAPPQFDVRALAAEYRAAALFCYPSLADRGEAFGLAALEAMACGVPPVVSALACFRDFIADGESGWVFDHRGHDPAVALAGILEGAMADPGALARVGRRAAQVALDYGYAQVARRYLDDFSELCAEAGRDA